jgi:stage III sporulation protein AB
VFIRLAGAVLVVLGSVALGWYYGAKDGLRMRDLQEMKKAMTILAAEIDYMRAPLVDACRNVAARVDGGVAAFFRRFYGAMENGEATTAYQLWSAAAAESRLALALSAEDYGVLDAFGKTLGCLNNKMQQDSIALTTNYLDEQIVSIQKRAEKSTRMYRSLGVIGGLLIVVVLW